MTQPNDDRAASAGGQADALARLRNRRLLLRGALGAAPALLTIASGPALATKAYTSSAQVSAAVSAATRGQYDCSGKSPASWCVTGGTGWHTKLYHGTTYSCQVNPSPCGAKVTASKTHKDVCGDYTNNTNLGAYSGSSTSLRKLAAHCGAAKCNIDNALVPAMVYDHAKIQQIWDTLCTSPASATWSPSPGFSWNIDQVCAWIATTFSS